VLPEIFQKRLAGLEIPRLDSQAYGNIDLIKIAEANMWMQNRFEFLIQCVYTYDETDKEHPVKLLPNLPHIKQIAIDSTKYKVLLVPKSRRMQATWTTSGIDLHVAMYSKFARVFIVSSDQTKSDKLVSRVRFIYDHLPEHCPKPEMAVRLGKSGDPTKLIFKETGSIIEGLSKEPDKIRQEGASLLHVEEIAFWDRPDDAYKAMLPTIQGGGQMIMVSSARDGTLFEQLVRDQIVDSVDAI